MIPAFTILGVLTWALAFWWGLKLDLLDERNAPHLLRIIAGAGCFAMALGLWLVRLVHG